MEVSIEFKGPNGSGKTLMMKVIKRALEACGCVAEECTGRQGHKMAVEVKDFDKLGGAARGER